MDKELFKLVEEIIPPINQVVTDGVAVREIRKVEGYVDRIWRCAEEDFPEGLKYLGFSHCTPQEEYAVLVERPQSTLELARSDVYMVKYQLSWHGELLKPCYMYLPYVNDAGIVNIRGSVFSISPVLADKAISVVGDSIFIWLNRDRLTFNRVIQHFYANGERESVSVVHSAIHHLGKKAQKGAVRPVVRGVHTLAHYLFAKYGVTRTFSEKANTDVVVGYAETVNAETYPPEEWIICSSTMRKPLRVRDRNYVGSSLLLAIRKADYNTATTSLIGGFFYVVDHFPQRIEPDYIDETQLWMVLLGHLIFGGDGSEGKLVEDISAHLRSLDGYLDNESKQYLRSDDINCEDLYDLFMYVIESYPTRVAQATSSLASMYDKRLMVLRYVLSDITRAINTFMYRLNANTKKVLTASDIRSLMDRLLKYNKIMEINRGHGEVSGISSPGDNKYFKITSTVVPQTNSSGTRSKKGSLIDPANFLHCSFADVGNYLTPSKSVPTGQGRINPCVEISPDGVIVRNAERRELLDEVQARIQR